jgi:alpha/beta superfamily hydrolase
MSDEKILQFEELINRFIKAGWSTIIAFIVIAFGFGAWIAALEYRTAQTIDAVSVMATEHKDFDRFKTSVNGNLHMAADHNRYAATVAEVIASHDKRLTRVEDATTRIDKSLDRIENKLGTK